MPIYQLQAVIILAGEKADHLFISMPEPPRRLIDEFRSLTDGLIGTVLKPANQWGIISLRERPFNWEAKYNRFILETYIIQITAACDWYIHTLVSEKIKDYLEEHYPAVAPNLLELRETRNCLLHSGGIVDNDYITKSGDVCRSKTIGTLIPLDWSYAFDRTLSILDFGYKSTTRKSDETTG